MSRDFAISTGSHKLQIGNTRSGSASFTVSNNTGNEVETRARLSAIDESNEAWFSIEGEKERTYTEKDAQQYTVKCEIPPDVKPGSYRFRLDIFAVENPDEIYSEGPVVELEVTEGKIETPDAPFPWWVVAVVVAVLMVGGGITGWVIYNAGKVEVADVMNQTEEAATQMLTDENFMVESTTQVTTIPDKVGLVVDQDPKAGKKANEESKVTLTIGIAPPTESVIVKTVVLETASDAERILIEKHFTVEQKTILTLDSGEVGHVVKQNPIAGSEVEKGSKVTLFIGKIGVKVPATVGSTLEEAIKKMNRVNLAYRILVSEELKTKITEFKRRELINANRPAPPPPPSNLTANNTRRTVSMIPVVPRVSKTTPPADTIVEKDEAILIVMQGNQSSRYKSLQKADLSAFGMSTVDLSGMHE